MVTNCLCHSVQELCEQELIRCVDPELVKTRRAVRKREEYCSVMLSNIEDGSSKAPIYEILANHEGNKRVCKKMFKTYLLIYAQANQEHINVTTLPIRLLYDDYL